MKDNVEIKVGNDLIGPIVEAKIQAAIVEALSTETGLVERVVAAKLTSKVRHPNHYEDVTFLDLVCEKVIGEAVEQAIREWASSHKEKLVAELTRQLSTKKHGSRVVSAMLDGFVEATQSNWRLKVELVSKEV